MEPTEGVPVTMPAAASSSPPSDHQPDFSPVGSPEHHHHPHPPDHSQALSDDLRHKIIKQVEYYFSDENLATDKFLMKYVSKDDQGFVPVGLIASFKKMKKLTEDISLIVAALRESSLLVVSSSGKKVRRLHPLPFTEIRDPQLCTVLVENLPENHSVENIRHIFGEAGNVINITIHDPHAVREQRKCTIAEKLLSSKLYALVEYDTVDAAEKAVGMLNNEQDWRYGLRVKLLKKMNKPGQKKKVWRELDPEKHSSGRASGPAGEEHHYQNEHIDDAHEEEEGEHLTEENNGEHISEKNAEHPSVDKVGDHLPREKDGDHAGKEKNGQRGRNRGHGRRQKYRGSNGHGHGTVHPGHGVEPSKPPPGPKMPDGTRGFTMGRGRPMATSAS